METLEQEKVLIDTTKEVETIYKDEIDTTKEVETINLSPDSDFVNIKYKDGTVDLLSKNSDIYKQLILKIEKKDKINKLYSMTDQFNLMAGVLAEYVEAIPENDRSEVQKKALKAYYDIQDILTN